MAKVMSKKQQAENRARVSRIFNERCKGIQINVMHLGKVMQVGLEAITAGDDDQVVGEKLERFARSISPN